MVNVKNRFEFWLVELVFVEGVIDEWGFVFGYDDDDRVYFYNEVVLVLILDYVIEFEVSFFYLNFGFDKFDGYLIKV